MIVGNGLIGSCFNNLLEDHENLLVFASGVSNSKESNRVEYEREIHLLQNLLESNRGKKLIYFSTCSLNLDPYTPYTFHKKFLENYIQTNVGDYLILRLPNVVGSSANKSQLVGYLHNCLLNKIKVTINVDCIRYLLDVADLPKIVKLLVELEVKPTILDVAFDNGVKVESILNYLQAATGKRFVEVERVQKGNDYKVHSTPLLGYIKNLKEFNIDPESIIKKYYTSYEP